MFDISINGWNMSQILELMLFYYDILVLPGGDNESSHSLDISDNVPGSSHSDYCQN